MVLTQEKIEAGEDLAVTIASFADLRLSPPLAEAVAKMGIDTPTPIQAAALPELLAGRDVIGQARTGSGKTLAFGIPLIEFVDPNARGVQALVLTPTRELANQVADVLGQLGRPKGVTVATIYGGVAIGPQRLLLRRGVNVVVGTPGRVLDLLNQGALWLDKIRFLVLDEADEMLDQGFAPDVERILGRATPDRQTSLFSATVPGWVRKTADQHLDRPVVVAVDPNPEDAAPIEHVAFDVPGGDKLAALKDLLDHRGEGSVIVFGRTKHGVKKLARQLEGAGYPVAALQGNLSQNARDRVMADFRSGAAPILLATNVAARGLDVTHVERVINVELPESPELLTHRIGRTGRMGRQGQAITLLGLEDGPKWRQLQRGLGRQIPRVPWRGAAAAVAGGFEHADAPGRPDAPGRDEREDGGREPRTGATLRSTNLRTGSRRSSGQGRDRFASGEAATIGRNGGGSVERWTSQATPRSAAPTTDQDDPRSLVARYGRDPLRSAAFEAAADAGESGRGRGAGPVATRTAQRHRIDCSDCGRPADVPFRPNPSRPVYCNDCFQARGRGRRQAGAVAQA